MIKDYLKMAVSNLRHRKIRAYLTMIGIFIGITAVISIISLGQGLQVAINEQFESLGTDKIFISPGTGVLTAGSTSPKLTENDRRVIERVGGVKDTLGMGYKSARIDYKDEQHFALVMGVTLRDGGELFVDSWRSYFDRGRLIEEGDNTKAYLTYDYTQDKKVFTHALKLGDKISINGQEFDVIGFQEKMGNSGDDQTVYISEEAYQRVFGEQLENDYKNLIVRVVPGADITAVAENIKKELRQERGLDEGDEDFTLQTPEELQSSFNSILLIVQVVIIGIAAISLVIGGIGIMNTMYTAVVERTQEIGIMKAIGARNSDIMLIFLIESGLLGFIGGLIGVVIGLVISKLIEVLGALWIGTPYLQAWWSWELIAAALLFSFVVGALSGLAPAYQASKQQPVESLRYE